MAEIEILHFHPGNSLLHRFDPRLKVLLMIVYIPIILKGVPLFCLIASFLLLTASVSIGLKPAVFRRELKVFGILACIILISGSIRGIEGGLSISEALWAAPLSGLVKAWRFILIVWIGILFTAVTNPVELHAVVYWLLKYIPGIPAGRLAAQTGFSLIILPLLLDAAHEIRDARKARGIEFRKNPLLRLSTLVNPLLEKLLLQMEEFSLALEARCFDEDVIRIRFHLKDGLIFWWLLYVLPALAMAGILFL